MLAAVYLSGSGLAHGQVTEASAAAPEKAREETSKPPTVENTKARSVEWFDGRPTEEISLRSAIELALKNNLDVQFDRVGINVERARIKFAAGVFDPVFRMSTQYQDVRQPQDINNPSTTQNILAQQQLQLQLNSFAQQLQLSNLEIANRASQANASITELNIQRGLQGLPPIQLQQVNTGQILPVNPTATPQLSNIITLNRQGLQFQTSVAGRTALGTQYAFQATVNRSRNTFSSDPNPVETLYDSSVALSIQQPLLKSFGTDVNLTELRTARINAKVQTLTWKNSISTAVQGVMAAYYDMDYALKDMQVREDSIAADSKLVELYRRRVELGFGSPLDIQQAQVAVATARELLLSSKNLFLERQYTLKQLMSEKFNTADPRIFVPTNAPNLTSPKGSRVTLLQEAFRNRYDYQALLLNAEALNLRLRFAKNQLLPSLDLTATYGLNGLGSSFGATTGDTFSGNNPQWSVGIQLEIPFGNRQAKAQYDAIASQKEQTIIRLHQRENEVGIGVDNALSRIETLRQRLAAARETREFGEEAVRIGFRRLEEGLISAYDLTEQQRKVYDAKSRELAASADLNKAITTLWLATGTVLERQGIYFDEPKDKYAPLPSAFMEGDRPVPVQSAESKNPTPPRKAEPTKKRREGPSFRAR